jgi:predicted GH43/DUF377 family glycosyl hydrolase
MRNSYKPWGLFFSILFAFTVVILVVSVQPPASANTNWWNTNWTRRRQITISPLNPENFQIKVVIPSDIPKSDYPSIRFLEDESSIPLSYWIERNDNGATPPALMYENVAWVRRIDNSDNTIWMYYHNAGVSPADSGDNVFMFFDDFGGGTGAGGQAALNTNRWGASSTGVDVYQTTLRLEPFGGSPGNVEHGENQGLSTAEENTPRIIEFRMKNSTTQRGGLILTGPSYSKETAAIFQKGSGEYRFWSAGCPGNEDGGYLSENNRPGDQWYILRTDLYGDNKNQLKVYFYWGNDNANYRQLIEVTKDNFTSDWAPPSPYVDKYNLRAWDDSSSYYFDWFFVRKWAAIEPGVTFGPEQSIPGKPLLYSPPNGTVTNENTPTFQWTIGANADNHQLLVDNDPDFSSPVENVLLESSDNSYLVTTPLADDNYSWQVIAINENGENPSDVWTYVVDKVPPSVSSTTPINNGIDISVKENVIVTFSETMNTSVTPTLQQIACSSSVAYTFSGWSTTTVSNDTATWTHGNWNANDNITLKVSGFRDLANNLGDNYIWSFTTKSAGFWPPEILASYTPASVDVNVYYNFKVEIRDNDNLSNVDEVWLKLYQSPLSQGAPDNVQNHYTFNWVRGVGFSEVGPGASNEHLNVVASSPGLDSVTTDNWTFSIKLDVTAAPAQEAGPAAWNLWVRVVDAASFQDNQEFASRFMVNPVPPTAMVDSMNPPFYENEFVKDNVPVLIPNYSHPTFDNWLVYNPAVIYENNKYYMFYRAQSLSGGTLSISQIGMATSTDGINFQRENTPAIAPSNSYDSQGVEDPRVVKIDNTYWMTYTAYDGSVARLALARSYDLENWVKVGLVFPIENGSASWVQTRWSKSGAIVPEKINGKYYMYFEGASGGGDLYYATSDDLLTWTFKDVVMERRKGYFDALTIEPGPTPIMLDNGILVLYNSLNRQLSDGGRLTTGWVIFSRDDPTKIIARCDTPFLVPELSWENSGNISTVNCVFSEGLVEVNNTWYLYYGGADTVVGLARAPFRDRSVLWSVKAQAGWKDGTLDNDISVRRNPDGIALVTADVQSWWRFNENTGTTAYDSSGLGNNGTISGAAWTAGKSGTALEFRRSDSSDVVNVGDRSSLEGFSALTISAWVYPYSYPQSGEIVKKDGVYLLRENNSGSGSVAFMVWDSGGNRYELDVPDAYLLKNQWSLITATWDGYRMRIYKNGAILAGESDHNFDSLASNSNAFTIGNQPGGGEGFDGKIDDVMIFNRAITEDEIRYLYNNPGFQAGVQSGVWISGWQNFRVQVRPENLEILTAVSAGENAKVVVEVSKNGSSVEDNTGWVLLNNGSNVIGLSSLPDCQYARVKFRLETENMRHSPIVKNFTFNAIKLRVKVSTGSASFAGGNSVTLKGVIIDLENADTQVWFEWRQKGTTPWNKTDNQVIGQMIPFSDNISGLTDNITYEFRAAIQDLNSGENTTGQILDFVMDGTPSSSFNLLSPENNSVFSEQPVLNWAPSSDNKSGLAHYEVWINGGNIDNLPADTTNFTTTLSTGLYTWYVVAVDYLGNKRVSNGVFKFTLVSPPASFELISPRDSYLLDNKVVLNWENSAGTAFGLNHYEVWINGNNVDNVEADNTPFITPELSQGSYQWYVVAVDNNGDKQVSNNVLTFNVGTPPPYLYRGSYFDGFENNNLNEYFDNGMSITSSGTLFGSYSARRSSSGTGYAYVSDLSLGEREGQVSVYFTVDSSSSQPGVGFASQDGTWVYAVVYPASNTLQVERRVAGYSIFDVTPPEYQLDGGGVTASAWTERQDNGYYIWRVENNANVSTISVGTKYQLTLDFSRRSMAAMAILQDLDGTVKGRVRAVVDVTTPEHPIFLSNGPAKFDNLRFNVIDNWVYNWEPSLDPVLSPTYGTWDEKGAFNPSVGIFDNIFRMVYRGNEIPAPGEESTPPDSSLGYATSMDGINWTKSPVPMLEKGANESLEDPVLLINPFNDNKNYVGYTDWTSGNSVIPSMMRWTTDFVNFSAPWTINSSKKTCAIIDTQGSPLGLVSYNGENYRFFSYMEGPDIVGLSNDLVNWPQWVPMSFGTSNATWSNFGDFEYPAGGMVMPDGNILVMTCMPADGYVGGAKATVGTAIFDGRQPWVLLNRATLPWAPVYYASAHTGRADVTLDDRSWYSGPNFPGKNFVFAADNWVYAYYGGNDQYSGVAKMRLAPEFEYRNLTLSKGTVNPKEPFVASVVVRNVGNLDGQENVKLFINGELENSKIVILGRNNETTVQFIVTINEGGVHAIQSGDMSSTVWVVTPAVAATTPENNSKALLNENVVVLFNKSMDASFIPTLTQTTGTPVAYAFVGWNLDNTSATWTHDNWNLGENITLKVSGYKDLLGNTGENYTWSFMAIIVPGKPTLISPADGTITLDNTHLFEWKCGDNADNHRLLVDNDPDFSSPEVDVLLGATDNTYTTTPLSPENYSWKVRAINTYGETESSVWTFLIEKEVLWTGTVTITLDNLYSVTISLDGDFGMGSNDLVAKFYTYGGGYQDNTLVDSDNIPGHVTLNKHVSRPTPTNSIQRIDLVVTDSGGTALGTIKTWATSRTVTIARVGQINGQWPFANEATRTIYVTELGSINGLWPFSPETYP